MVVPASDADAGAADRLARELGLPLVRADWRQVADFALRLEGDRLSVVNRESRDTNGVSADFPSIPVRHGRISVSRDEPLGRAFGTRVRTIVDATAGLGHDVFLLACMGFDVTAMERSPIIAALLRNGVERAMSNGRIRKAIEGRLRIVCGDARDILASMEHAPDAIYLDPMFPDKRKKSALAKKAIRIVRAVVGDDPDANQLLAVALRTAKERVVVKRADDAPPLMPGPVASIRGNTVRYDVYHPQQAAASLSIPSD